MAVQTPAPLHITGGMKAPDSHSKRKRTMALRGAQGDHPIEGRGAPEAEAVQPSQLVVVAKPMESSCGGSCWEPRGLMEDGRPSGVVRGECRGGLGGAAAPNRPPLDSPRTTPLGFPSSTNSLGSQQLPPKDNPARLSHFRQSARAARLLLRELPSLRSGDLPARRAMPSCAVALNENPGLLCRQ